MRRLATIVLLAVVEILLLGGLAVPSHIKPYRGAAAVAFARYVADPIPENQNHWLAQRRIMDLEESMISGLAYCLAGINAGFIVWLYRRQNRDHGIRPG